jgi:hypothetical protein
MDDSNVKLIIFILASIVIFLICRELNCWYWKINAIVSRLDTIIEGQDHSQLPRLNRKPSRLVKNLEDYRECPECGAVRKFGTTCCWECMDSTPFADL